VPHICAPTCECRADLDKATLRLTDAIIALSVCIFGGSYCLIETEFWNVKAAEVKLKGAIMAYQDHFTEA
jgi:hypothetical protein